MTEYDKAQNLNKQDALTRQPVTTEQDRGAGLSPMAPPEAGSDEIAINVAYEDMHPFFQELIDEHRELDKVLENLEKIIEKVKKVRGLDTDTERMWQSFLNDFNEMFFEHNQREEWELFPLLKEKLLAAGEHSKGPEVFTGVDILISEHVQGLKLFTSLECIFNLLKSVVDSKSREVLLAHAVIRGKELLELMKMHIEREDRIIFGLAMKLFTEEELGRLKGRA